jgi:phosphatidylglycerophosphate synthase
MLSAPELLIAFRAVCAPAMFVLACFGFSGELLAGLLVAAFLSDVFDGMIARQTGTATPGLRYADTVVDTIFYTSAAVALWVAAPHAFDGAGWLLIAFVTIHVSRATFELTKFGRVASYHMWSSKALGVVIAAALAIGFLTLRATALVPSALCLGIVNELEGFLASVILPAWTTDVPSAVHAYRMARVNYPTSQFRTRT